MEKDAEWVGMIQLSAQLITLTLKPQGKSHEKDKAEDIEVDPNTFDSYINPNVRPEMWLDHLVAVHGLRGNDPRITSAPVMSVVWERFCRWVDSKVPEGDVATLVAWNGEHCDMKELWKLTQAPNSSCHMPPQLQYFLDPYRVISHYTKCPINKKISKIESYSLGEVWKYLDPQKRNLNGAHNSLIDVIAQGEIFIHESMHAYINRSKSIQHIDEIFSKAVINAWKKTMEPLREVHSPWKEIKVTDEHYNKKWEPRGEDTYTSSAGGPKYGPTNKMQTAATNTKDLADLFLVIIPLAVLTQIAKYTKKYAYDDWVVEKPVKYLATGEFKKRPVLHPSKETDEGARRRCKTVAYEITAGYVLAFLGILIVMGAHFGSDKKTTRKMWRSAPYGLPLSYVQNCMPRDAFEFMRRHIHFCDNDERKKRGQNGYDPLFKVIWILRKIMDGLQDVWHAGKHICIDESMIKYQVYGKGYLLRAVHEGQAN